MGASAQTQPASSSVPAPFGGMCFWCTYWFLYGVQIYVYIVITRAATVKRIQGNILKNIVTKDGILKKFKYPTEL